MCHSTVCQLYSLLYPCDFYHICLQLNGTKVLIGDTMDTTTSWADLVAWFHGGTKISYKKGEIIIRPEDKPRDVFLMSSGWVKVYELTSQGDENIVNFKQEGDVFPLIWASTPIQRDTYYETTRDVVTYRRSLKAFNQYILENKDVAFALMERLAELYLVCSNRIHNLEFRYARERMAYRLNSLTEQYGKKTGRGIEIELPIKQLELADSINVTRETASRELLRLRKKKIIDYDNSTYIVLNRTALKKEF